MFLQKSGNTKNLPKVGKRGEGKAFQISPSNKQDHSQSKSFRGDLPRTQKVVKENTKYDRMFPRNGFFETSQKAKREEEKHDRANANIEHS